MTRLHYFIKWIIRFVFFFLIVNDTMAQMVHHVIKRDPFEKISHFHCHQSLVALQQALKNWQLLGISHYDQHWRAWFINQQQIISVSEGDHLPDLNQLIIITIDAINVQFSVNNHCQNKNTLFLTIKDNNLLKKGE